MTRITTSGGGGGGGLTVGAADLLYIKKAGDTVPGSLLFDDGSSGVVDNSPLISFRATTPTGPYIYLASWYAKGNETDGYGAMVLEFSGPHGIGNESIGLINSSDGSMAWGPLDQDGYTSLGRSAARYKDLWLAGSIKDGSLGETLDMDTDEAYDIGDTSKGLRQIVFSDASTGSNRAAFRGSKCIGYAGGDIYWGIDDVFPGYYVQKTVVAGSTATDNSQDYTNIYQGDSSYRFIALNFGIARTVDANGNPTNGVTIGSLGSVGLGCPLVFMGGPTRLFEMYLDNTNTVMRMECGKTTTTRIPKLEIRLAGTGPAIRPYSDNLIDFGESSLTWKDGYFKGDVRQRQAIATGDNAGVASTNSLTGTSDLTTNSTGVGTILFKGTTSRNSTGFIKFYVGTTAYYVPVFSAITG